MTGMDWVKLVLAIPAAIAAIIALAAVFTRWLAPWAVFGVLKQHPHQWLQAAKDSHVFDELFQGADLSKRIELDNAQLRTLVTEKLLPIAAMGAQLTTLNTTVTVLSNEVQRFSKVVEDLPERLAVVEDRTTKHPNNPSRGPRR